MKKYLSCLLSVLLFLTACSTNEKLDEENIDKPSKSELYAEKTMANMTLEEKIGQLIYMDYRNLEEMNVSLEKILSTYHPGGFILFKSKI